MARNPGHVIMTPRQRYRQRRKLQAALGRVAELLIMHEHYGIAPDRNTAEFAASIAERLRDFAVAANAGVDIEDPLQCVADVLINRGLQKRLAETDRRWDRRQRARRKQSKEWQLIADWAEAMLRQHPEMTFEEWQDDLARQSGKEPHPWWRKAWEEARAATRAGAEEGQG